MIPDDDAFGVTIRTRRLELVTDVELNHIGGLTDLAERGIHDPAVQPFGNSWTDAEPREVGNRVARFLDGCWNKWSADDWHCPFTVLLDGVPIGVQEVSARQFGILRMVRTGSWLGLGYQNRGYGTEMRCAVLDFAFTGLRAYYAVNVAHADNTASQAVNRKLGYAPNGSELRAVRGQRLWARRYLLTPEAFTRVGDGAVWSGLDASRPAFGVPDE